MAENLQEALFVAVTIGLLIGIPLMLTLFTYLRKSIKRYKDVIEEQRKEIQLLKSRGRWK